MKQVLQYRRSGATRVVEVPAPLTPSGGLLVQNQWSLISPGTERMLVEAGGSNLINTARQRPELVKQVADKLAREGVSATFEAVRSRLDVGIPLGYSCAGTVLDVGTNARAAFSRDDRVACAGAGQANHAEIVAVPRNLTVRVPDGVSLDDAAFVTVGAIALQGVRIADVRLGEACVVIGLGLVGQLTVQLLRAAGCRVFGIDVAADKVELARAQGADGACVRSDPDVLEKVRAFSLGRGADAILIAAATGSSDPIQLAPKLARDRAVVVAVGMIGMDVPRNPYYEKELQVRLSRSYGPGRYDRSYEEDGVDYPVGYVRWTEQRNMEAFLDLVSAGRVHPSQLVTHRVPIADAERAYRIVTGEVVEPYLGILLEYPHRPAAEAPTQTRVEMRPARPAPSQTVRLGVIGAGSFARSVLLPALKKLDVEFRGVATWTAPSAQQTAARFGFGYAATDWRQVVDDTAVDAVLVATRHDLHAGIAAAALRAGKAVFLEKPMALNEADLEDLLAACRSSDRVLQVGFNRRFAPTFQQMKARYAGRRAPLVLAYRVNAGAVASTSWVVDPVQGGGRLLGEVCHMVDTLVDLVGASVVSVYAQGSASVSLDDVVLTLTFGDGSIGTIVYASGGDRSLPKEYLEVLGGGCAAVLEDFRTLRVHAAGRTSRLTGHFSSQDKGHTAELTAFLDAVRTGQPSPIPPAQAAHVTRVTFAAVESIRTGSPVQLS
ncbi:MAG: bi-domain-containing oxidoreductase [Chloroflexota bacterium]|nr:bi-domain-containing oxidoreductase [Chloroflexota bacterium]